MRCFIVLAFLNVFLFPTVVVAQTSAPIAERSEATGRLPVKKVVLYKNGVGYFEHAARVRGTQELSIDFTTAQLNDVLKSLTVLDLGEGRISSVRYNSVAPLSERLGALRLPLGENATQEDFLNALRGTRLYARTGGDAATGKLLSVETRRKPAPKGETPTEATEIVLVTDGGEMRTFELGPETTVRVADRDLNEEVGQYFDVLGSARAQDLRRMTIAAAGSGERDIFVSYISEVPVWKSTYRIILPDKPGEKPLLQGWAIVDNTIGEDWKDVQLSLVAGAPQSFVQQISQPYYVRRPFVAMPESMALTPQTHEAALKQLQTQADEGGGFGRGAGGMLGVPVASLEGTVTDPSGAVIPNARVTIRNEMTGASQTTRTDSSGNYSFQNVQAGNSALFVESPGFKRYALTNIYLGVGRTNEINANLDLGAPTATVMVEAEAPTVETSQATVSRLVSGALRQRAEAEGKELGDLFEYDVKQKITIEKNQSALVPILQARIDAEKVTTWAPGTDQPRRALWVTNTSGLTLDGGTFNVLDNDAFAGEGLIELLHPGEKRLVSYAADLAVRISSEAEAANPVLRKVSAQKGIMLVTEEQNQTVTYRVSNFDTNPRTVIIEHPAEEEWELMGDSKPEETTATTHRFRIKVEPKKTARLVVSQRRPWTTRFELSDLDDDDARLLLEDTKVSPATLKVIQRIMAQKGAIENFDERVKARQQELDAIAGDQTRLRENMKALKGSAEEQSLLQRYVRQLDAQEDRIAALRAEIVGLEAKRQAAQAELEKTLAEMTLEVAL